MRNDLLFALGTCLLAFGCASTSNSPEGHTRHSDSPWLQASPSLRQQIDDQIARLPWTHGVERVEQISWFAGVGEPAYESLLELCSDPRPDVAASAVAAIGATGDARLVEPLRQVEWASDDPSLSFERARAFLRLGDWGSINVLVDGLADDSQWTRAWCIRTLREATGTDFGFDPVASPEERAPVVERWRSWVASRLGEGILAGR